MSVLKVKNNGVWEDVPSIKGETGDAAGFGTVTATVDTNVGTPTVVVTSSGEDTAKNFSFQFKNLGYDDSDLQDDFADLADDFDVLQGQFDTAVAAVTTDTEVTDIRVGADGVTDTTAGASVRRQFTNLKGFLNELTEPTKNLFVPEILLSVNGWQWNNDSFSGAIQPLYDAYKNVSIPITFEENKQYTLSYKAKTDGNAGTTGFGLRFFFKYSDDTTSYSSAINNNVSTYTSVKLTSTAGKTVVGLFVNLGSYGQNIWYIKDIQLEEGATQTEYEFTKNAVDKVSRAAQFVNLINELSFLANRYIKYADGSIVGSGTYFKSYYIKNNGFSKVVANLYCGDAVPAAIAFYSSETIGADSYIKSSSVQAKAGWAYHEASVPENCKMIAFTHRTDYAAGSGTPYISLNLADLVPYTYSLAETSSVTANKAFDNSCLELYRDMKPCYDHLYVSTTGNNIVIPSESIYHIRHSRAMGFNVIEANVQKTSDDVFIVHHLSGGKFGDYFHHVDGETDISNIAVSSVTWDWIATNVRYNSQIPKYRTRPCRLEEFLHECKQQNLIPFLGVTSVTLGAVAIADAIMGQYNYIVYGAERKACPNAILYHWVTKETKEEMLAYCESIGKPFIYGISNPHTFTDSELSEIVETLHKAGYCIGSSYIDRAWCKYRYLGFDFNGTTVCMNRIENGNLHNITSAFGFSDYVVTNATETDGVLTFTSDGTIQPNIDNTAYDICGIDIEIWFDGTIIVQSIGEKTNPYTYDSDGSYPIFLSIPIINGSPKFTIDCTLGTVVYDLNFKASVF